MRRASSGASRRGGWLLAGAAAVAMTVAGCASLGGADPGTDDGVPSASDSGTPASAPFLQVVVAGGFVPMGYDFSRVPDLTVYGDGRAISYGPQIAIWPPPALPNLLLTQLDADDVTALIESAREAGLLGEVPDYGQPPVADAPTTVLTLTVDGETYVHAANALGIGDGVGEAGQPSDEGMASDGSVASDGAVASDEPVSGLSDDARGARVALAAFIAHAREVVGAAEATESYPITAFGVMARPSTDDTMTDDTVAEPEPGTAPEIDRQVIAWPLDVALADATQCVIVDGTDAVTLRQTLEQASSIALYEQGGTRYDVFFRPLLPDEDGCADLV